VRGHGILLALSMTFAALAASSGVFAETSPPKPAVIVKTMTVDEVVAADGTYTTTFHVERLATNQSAAQKIAQHTLEYSESLETAEIAEAFTRKTDGRVLQVDRSRIFPQAPPGSPRVPMFTDVQERVTLPKAMTAHIEARDVEHHIEEAGDNTTHIFVYRNPLPPAAAAAALSPWDTDPQYTISTFADYAAVAAAYRRMADGKAAVTPRIQALADEITAGTTDRREQAHLIYDWVSKHVRYVAIFLGNGGYEPHAAAAILENGYGDCKDHVVVLEALLAAKGIASAPVLINNGNRYRLPEAATPATFNHVLSYLPEFNLYADSTVGVAPFGTLTASEYGKPVAVAAEPSAFLDTLPLVVTDENEEKLQTTAQLMPDGTVSGQSITVASGPFGISLRQLAASVEARGQSQWAETYFKSRGWHGTASFQFDPPRDRLAPVYAFSASFELEARPEFLDGKAFGPPEGVPMLVRPGEFLIGSWTLPKAAPTPCFSGHQIEVLSLTLPPGRNVNSLPTGKTVENPYLHYQSEWNRESQTITVRREITVRLPDAVCRDEIRAKLAEAIAEIRGDYSSTIALEPLVH